MSMQPARTARPSPIDQGTASLIDQGPASLTDQGPASLIDQGTASLIADAMFALSAPSRVQILGCLLDGPLAVGEITARLGMEQSAVSHQLRVLREAELVRAERHGKRRLYKLSGDAVRELLTAARHLAGTSRPGGQKAAGG